MDAVCVSEAEANYEKEKKEFESRESLRKGRNYVSCCLFFIDIGSKVIRKMVRMRLQMSLGGFVGPSASQ